MNNSQETMGEKVLRLVSTVGNGAHVFVPKEWVGEQVELVRIAPKKNPEELVLNNLRNYFNYIEGLYLIGSYARSEPTSDSDVDILVITNQEIKFDNIKNLHIVQIVNNKIQFTAEENPVLFYSMLIEAKSIINNRLLDELRAKYIPRKLDFKSYMQETKNILQINLSLLEDEEKSLKLNENAYSIILRLRGIYLIKSILEHKKYSNKILREEIIKRCNIDYDSIYSAYNSIKNGKNCKILLDAKDLRTLILFAEKKIKEINL